jgi:gamma-glutamylcyclotransferase (GGCT)/AIG2-like uncharacterized protein YtfP
MKHQMRSSTHVFVYGTLLRGEPNHHLLARATFVRAAQTTPRFSLVSLGAFPGLLVGGDATVVGEVYAVDVATLAALDRLEGHPRFYRRTAIDLAGGGRAAAYVLPTAEYAARRTIADGDWRAHRRRVAGAW